MKKHEIREGETLSDVAHEHGVTVSSILFANPARRRARTLSGAPCFHEDAWISGETIAIPPRALGAPPGFNPNIKPHVQQPTLNPAPPPAFCRSSYAYVPQVGLCVDSIHGNVSEKPDCPVDQTWDMTTKSCVAKPSSSSSSSSAGTLDTTAPKTGATAGEIVVGVGVAAIAAGLVYAALHTK